MNSRKYEMLRRNKLHNMIFEIIIQIKASHNMIYASSVRSFFVNHTVPRLQMSNAPNKHILYIMICLMFLSVIKLLSCRRSLCTLVCKWTYSPSEGWDDTFWSAVGLEDLMENSYSKIGGRECGSGVCVCVFSRLC